MKTISSVSSVTKPIAIDDIRSLKQLAQTMKWRRSINMPTFTKVPLRNAVIAAGLVAGLSLGAADAASTDTVPQPHSNSVGAAITGSATRDAKALAAKLAKGVDGVRSVDGDMKTPTSSKAVDDTKRAVSDSWITTKVKSELLANSMSKGFKISVTTTHGVVVLTGALANQDAIDNVKDLAEKVDGVKSVDISAVTVAAK